MYAIGLIYQEHVHARVCSALTDSVLAVSWRIARPYLGMAFGPTHRPVPSVMIQDLTSVWTKLSCFRKVPHSVDKSQPSNWEVHSVKSCI